MRLIQPPKEKRFHEKRKVQLLKQEENKMRTRQQDTATRLTTACREIFEKQEEIPISTIAALGIKLVHLMWDRPGCSAEFKRQTSIYHDKALAMLTLEDGTTQVGKYINELGQRAEIFSQQRMPKHTEYVLAIQRVLMAMAEDNRLDEGRHITRAVTHAYFAGAHYERLLSTVALLFG